MLERRNPGVVQRHHLPLVVEHRTARVAAQGVGFVPQKIVAALTGLGADGQHLVVAQRHLLGFARRVADDGHALTHLGLAGSGVESQKAVVLERLPAPFGRQGECHQGVIENWVGPEARLGCKREARRGLAHPVEVQFKIEIGF